MLVKESAVALDQPTIISSTQAVALGRASDITVELYGSAEAITAIQVRGNCIEVARGSLLLPEYGPA